MEQSLYTRRLEVAKRYARANKLNNVVLREPGRLARHHHRRQDLQRPAPVVPRAGPRRRGAAPLRRPHPQDGHAVPDGAARSCATSRAASRRSSSSRRSAPSSRCSPRTCSTARPTRRASSASSTRRRSELLPHYGEFESDVIGRALTSAAVAQGAHRIGRGLARAARRDPRPRQAADGGAYRVVLLGLPAQQLDGGGRRQRRLGRHRLPHDGDVDGPQRRDGHPHGRRGRAVDRHGAVHRHQAHLPEHGRRHLRPLRQPRRSATAPRPTPTSRSRCCATRTRR